MHALANSIPGRLAMDFWELVIPGHGHFSPGTLLLCTAFLTGIFIALLFAFLDGCRPVRRSRDAMLAAFLEFAAFSGGIRTPWRLIGRIASACIIHLAILTPALGAALAVLTLLLTPLENWLGRRPFLPDETGTVRVQYPAPFGDNGLRPRLIALNDPLADLDGPIVHDDASGTSAWRIRAQSAGSARFEVQAGDISGMLTIHVGTKTVPLPLQHVISAVPATGPNGPTCFVEIAYPRRAWRLAGRSVEWHTPFLLAATIAALLLNTLRRLWT